MSRTPPGAHLARAWVLAERGRDRTNPNPFVGCVIERDGEIVGEGWTQPAGGEHAEVVALAEAGPLARGASAWVTIEPCNHVGRTAPCSRALHDAGVGRVVFALADPNVAAAGGAEWLAQQGIAVERWPWDAWVRHQNELFVTNVEQSRPWLTLKLAATRDGHMVVPEQWITHPSARAEVHALRARVDAVLVGSGTAIADDPRLDVRDAPLLRGQPRAVVVDRRGRTPSSSRVLRAGTIVLTSHDAPAAWRTSLQDKGVEIVDTDPDAGPQAWLAALFERGIGSVLAEPGPTLAAALCAAGVVDEVVLHQAPGDGPARLPEALAGRPWRHLRTRPIGRDAETILRPRSD